MSALNLPERTMSAPSCEYPGLDELSYFFHDGTFTHACGRICFKDRR